MSDKMNELFYGISLIIVVVAGISFFAIGTVKLATPIKHECHDELAVPGYGCDSGARLVIEGKFAICRCDEGAKDALSHTDDE